jgi:hypothetical protein
MTIKHEAGHFFPRADSDFAQNFARNAIENGRRVDIDGVSGELKAAIIKARDDLNWNAAAVEAAKQRVEAARTQFSKMILQAMRDSGADGPAAEMEEFFSGELEGGFMFSLDTTDWVVDYLYEREPPRGG